LFQDKKRIIATLKHFAAHGQPESGINCAPTNVSMRLLRETFLQPFKDAIQKANAISVMASYNEIDGVPSHASEWLLRDVLRKEWGFKGFIVSDYYADLGAGLPSGHARSLCGQRQKGILRARGAGRGEHRVPGAGLLLAPRRTRPPRRAAGIPARRTGGADVVLEVQDGIIR